MSTEHCTCPQAALSGLPYDPGCPVHFLPHQAGEPLDSEGGRGDGPAMTNPHPDPVRDEPRDVYVYPISTRCPLECGGWDEAWHGLAREPVPGRSHHARGCPEQVIRVRLGDPVGKAAAACEAALLEAEREEAGQLNALPAACLHDGGEHCPPKSPGCECPPRLTPPEEDGPEWTDAEHAAYARASMGEPIIPPEERR